MFIKIIIKRSSSGVESSPQHSPPHHHHHQLEKGFRKFWKMYLSRLHNNKNLKAYVCSAPIVTFLTHSTIFEHQGNIQNKNTIKVFQTCQPLPQKENKIVLLQRVWFYQYGFRPTSFWKKKSKLFFSFFFLGPPLFFLEGPYSKYTLGISVSRN